MARARVGSWLRVISVIAICSCGFSFACIVLFYLLSVSVFCFLLLLFCFLVFWVSLVCYIVRKDICTCLGNCFVYLRLYVLKEK